MTAPALTAARLAWVDAQVGRESVGGELCVAPSDHPCLVMTSHLKGVLRRTGLLTGLRGGGMRLHCRDCGESLWFSGRPDTETCRKGYGLTTVSTSPVFTS